MCEVTSSSSPNGSIYLGDTKHITRQLEREQNRRFTVTEPQSFGSKFLVADKKVKQMG